MPLHPAESSCEEGLNEIPGHFRTDRPSVHAEDIHVIVFDAVRQGPAMG